MTREDKEGEDVEDEEDDEDEDEERDDEEREDEEGEDEEREKGRDAGEEQDDDDGQEESDSSVDGEGGTEEGKRRRAQRVACPRYQQSGCILDQLEKACGGEADEMMKPSAFENVWMCCCPEPYVQCEREAADAKCVSTIQGLTKEKPKLDQNGLLELRRELLTGEPKCSNFVHLNATNAECKGDRRWTRAMPSLMCEMLTWQWEELGDGNRKEFDSYNCPMYNDLKAKNGGDRKMQMLTWDPREESL